jgi:hypothetical protein
MAQGNVQLNADDVQAIFLNPFNDLISVLKSLDVDAIDLCKSVFVYEGEDIFIEIDVSGLLSSDVEGLFPLDEKNLKKLSNVIISDKGHVQIVKNKHSSIVTIKKTGSKHEYHLEKLKNVSTIPAAIKIATDISDIIPAHDKDLKHFQNLYTAKELFVLQDNKKFCITSDDMVILDDSRQTFQQSYSLPRFISYHAMKADFRIKEQIDGNNKIHWLHVAYQQNDIEVDVYLKLTLATYSPGTKSKPTLNIKDLTPRGHITASDYDTFCNYLTFFSDFDEVTIYQGKTYGQNKNSIIAYCDSSLFFSAPVSFTIEKPKRFKKDHPELNDNASSSVPYDLKVRKEILIAQHTNGKIIFIRVPPNTTTLPTLKDYLAAEYFFEEFDTISQLPTIFKNIPFGNNPNRQIDAKQRESILSAEYYRLTDENMESILEKEKVPPFAKDEFKKPDKQTFFDDMMALFRRELVGYTYQNHDQFSNAFDDETREIITAIELDADRNEVHARRKDFLAKQNYDPRFPVITQSDINPYRSIVTKVAKKINNPTKFQLYSEQDQLKFCVAKGAAEITHPFEQDSAFDSMFESKHFLEYNANAYRCSIENNNGTNWLITNHLWSQKDILTYEDVVHQKTTNVVTFHSVANGPVVNDIEPLPDIEDRIVDHYENHLDYRFKMLQEICNVLKYKNYYFKDPSKQTAFFDRLKVKMKIAQSTIFADRRIAEMLISLDKEDILDDYKKGRSHKLLRITSAYDDHTKLHLLKHMDDYNRDDIDRFVKESRPQVERVKDQRSKIRGMKIKKERQRIVLTFNQRRGEKKPEFDKKMEKIHKFLSKLNESILD